MKMTVNEMIKKWRIELAEQDGQEALKAFGKPTQKQTEELRAKKPEIIAELKRRASAIAEREAKRIADEIAEREAIISGERPMQLFYHDGEYLSGWETVGQSAEIMQELGLTKYINGWGYLVDSDTIGALGGSEITYQAAAELAEARKRAKDAKKAGAEAATQTKFDEARKTGKPVILHQWISDCCDPSEECSTDSHYEYAMPDGSTKHEWHHTW